MAGVYQIEIAETEAELKQRLADEKTGSGQERIQVLYLLKSQNPKNSCQHNFILQVTDRSVCQW